MKSTGSGPVNLYAEAFNDRLDVLAATAATARQTGIALIHGFFLPKEIKHLRQEFTRIRGSQNDAARSSGSYMLSVDEHPLYLALQRTFSQAGRRENPNFRITGMANRWYDRTHPRLHPHIDARGAMDLQFGLRFGDAHARFWLPDGELVEDILGPSDLYVMRGGDLANSNAQDGPYVFIEAETDEERAAEAARLTALHIQPIESLQAINDERIWHAMAMVGRKSCHSVVLRQTI